MTTTKTKQDITKIVNTVEDAFRITGSPATPEFLEVREDLRDYFKAQYEAIIVVEALNEGWVPDWSDDDQEKWFPWMFHEPKSPSGFAFCDASYGYSGAAAGGASRLCCETRAKAEHFGRQFTQIIDRILRK